MKIILILLDGLGDRSYLQLNNQTPLQAAYTPNLDRLAQLGGNGLFHAASLGQCLPSETAHFLLFGYDLKQFPGRGLLEAVGEGVPFDDCDVLSLAHLAGISWQDGVPLLRHGRGEIAAEVADTRLLYESIREYETQGVRFRLHQTQHNDAILVMSGPVSPHVSDSDPMVRGSALARIHPLAENPEPAKASLTARALNEYLTHCHRVLGRHDVNRSNAARNRVVANFLATQRCGRRLAQEAFHLRWGMKAMLVASGAVYGGLARELGMTFVRAEDGADPGADLRQRIGLALDDDGHEFYHIHTKAPDDAAHKSGPEAKAAVIGRLDSGLADLVEIVARRNDLLVVVMADHSTPSASPLVHSGEPVPVAMVGATVRRDRVTAFDEVSAAGGCLGLLRGREVMLTILNYADRAVLAGHHLAPDERPYVPKAYEPFRLTDEMGETTEPR